MKEGENPNIRYPQYERGIKIAVFKQQCVPNTGTKNAENGGNLGKTRGKFARRSRHAKVLSLWPADCLQKTACCLAAAVDVVGGRIHRYGMGSKMAMCDRGGLAKKKEEVPSFIRYKQLTINLCQSLSGWEAKQQISGLCTTIHI